MKYKGIIFDLDGVLCSTDRFHFEAWKQTAEEVGAPFDETINMKLRGVSRMESLEIILSGSSKTFTDAEKERLATEKNDRYRKLLAQMSPAEQERATLSRTGSAIEIPLSSLVCGRHFTIRILTVSNSMRLEVRLGLTAS